MIPLSGAAVGAPAAVGRKAIQAHAEQLGSRQAQVKLVRVRAVPGGHVARFAQVHQGLTVLDTEQAVLMLNGRLVALTGKLHALTSVAVGQLDADAAARAARSAMPGARVRRSHQAIWANAQASGQARTVWVLDVATARPFGLWQVLVDARTGEVLWSRSTMQHAEGKVYSTNPKVGSLVKKPLKGLTDGKELVGAYASVSRCKMVDNKKVSCDRLAKPDTNGDFIYEPNEGVLNDPFAEVQGYYHVDTFHRWLKDSFKFARQGTQLINMYVNFHTETNGNIKGYSNAFYGDLDGDGRGDLVFGQSSRDFAYDADVIYHEFGHSVVHETSGLSISVDKLGLNAAPAALNEGFADLLSSTYVGDAVVGDYMGNYGNGIRNLSGKSYSCPDNLIGESHQDGLIWGRAVWAIRSQLSDTKTFDQVLYTTVATLTKNSGFADAAKLLITVAQSKDAALAKVADTVLKARGLTTCTRIVPLKPAQRAVGYIYGKSTVAGLAAVPGPVQYSIEVPRDVTSLDLEIKRASHYGGSMGAYIRKGSTVDFHYNGSTYDAVKDTSSNEISLATSGTKYVLEPGATYYVLPLNTGNYTSAYAITYTLKSTPAPKLDSSAPVTPDAGPPAADDGGLVMADGFGSNKADDPTADRGCSCELGSGTGPGNAALLLALAVVGLLWRRRRAG